MGIVYLHVGLFASEFRPGVRKADRVLTLGNQDIHFTYDQAVQFFRMNGLDVIDIPATDRRTANSHGTVPNNHWSNVSGLLHQTTLFAMMGYDPAQVQSVDVDPYENADLIHDFNAPVPRDWVGQYDMVVDFGTVEHIFDVRQNFANIVDVLAVGGTVLHFAPANIMNHGLFNLTTGLMRDVYLANGFDLVRCDYVASKLDRPGEYRIIEDQALSEIDGVPGHYLAVRGVFKKRETVPFTVPKQGLYQSLHAAWQAQVRDVGVAQATPAMAAPKRSLFDLMRPKRVLPGQLVQFRQPSN